MRNYTKTNMHRIIFIIQISLLFLYLLFKISDWPGTSVLAVFSWTFTYLFYTGLSIFQIFKKDFNTALFYFLFSLIVLCIPIKILFTYYNVVIHFALIAIFGIMLFKQYKLELNKHFKYLIYLILFVNTMLLLVNSNIVNQNVFSNHVTIPYSCGQVDWSHFNKTDTLEGNHTATIDTYIMIKPNKMYNYRSAIATAVVNRDGSFYKHENEDVLKHENYHFKLTEVICRKLNTALDNNHFASYEITKSIIHNYLDSLNLEQIKYDTESNHGVNRAIQLHWEKEIDAQLLKE
jgi:hypothetical protein